ncbi:hypothetical protein KSD_95370 [Ktedonobacter sp. SOSP1-85]|nr:hypothetical protein KSD_95370 [Ktedonobacter sp. SOSP1-85]
MHDASLRSFPSSATHVESKRVTLLLWSIQAIFLFRLSVPTMSEPQVRFGQRLLLLGNRLRSQPS